MNKLNSLPSSTDPSTPLAPEDGAINLRTVLTVPENLVDETSSIEDFVKEDILHANNVVRALYAGWGSVNTINGIIKMSSATMDALKKRRELALKPASYGEKVQTNKKNWNTFEDV